MKAKKLRNKASFLYNLVDSVSIIGSTDRFEFDYLYKFDIKIGKIHAFDHCKFFNIYENR